MAKRKVETSSNLRTARARFEQWRKTRTRKSPIPDELWEVAIHTARQEGVNQTAQQLHLDAGKLKRLLVNAEAGPTLKAASQPRFVELIAPLPVAPSACVVEFESAQGSKMRIHWKAPTEPDWTSLLRCWRDAER